MCARSRNAKPRRTSPKRVAKRSRATSSATSAAATTRKGHHPSPAHWVRGTRVRLELDTEQGEAHVADQLRRLRVVASAESRFFRPAVDGRESRWGVEVV